MDTVRSAAGAVNTLSLGGGIGYEDLSLSRNGADLALNVGGTDHIVFKDWYAGNANVVNLQIILDATGAYDAGSPGKQTARPVLFLARRRPDRPERGRRLPS